MAITPGGAIDVFHGTAAICTALETVLSFWKVDNQDHYVALYGDEDRLSDHSNICPYFHSE